MHPRILRRGPRASRGFTLMELMITVAIVGILSAVAYPAYTAHIAKGRRAEARATLVEAAQWMERFYSENYRYDKNTAGTATTDTTLFPAAFSQVPATGSATYTLTLSFPADTDGRAYTITAARTGAAEDDSCGDYVIDQAGSRSVKNASSTLGTTAEASASCWR